MKKLLVFLLAAILLITTLAACGKDEETSDTSSINSSSTDATSEPADESSEPADVTSETADESSEEPVEESSEEPVNFFTDEIDLEGEKTNVSVGKTYTGTDPNHSAGQDPDKTKLTDGVLSPDAEFNNGTWCGYDANAGTPYDLFIDLGEDISGIGSFSVNMLGGNKSGIIKTNFTVEVSLDNINWHTAGTYTADINAGEAISEIYDEEVVLETGCTARYVKFSFPGNSWTFISELSVFAYHLV